MNDKFSTDLSREDFDFKDSKQFAKEMLIYWLSAFGLGAFIATFLIMLSMKIFVG